MTAMPHLVKSSNSDNLESVFDTLVRENPEYFPYGITKSALSDIHRIETDDGQTAGFTAMQYRYEQPTDPGRKLKKIGYYVVGVLPEYRGKKIAGAAVRTMLRKYATGCSEIRAWVHEDNLPSIKLAQSLGVTIETFSSGTLSKKANLARLKNLSKEIDGHVKHIQKVLEDQKKQRELAAVVDEIPEPAPPDDLNFSQVPISGGVGGLANMPQYPFDAALQSTASRVKRMMNTKIPNRSSGFYSGLSGGGSSGGSSAESGYLAPSPTSERSEAGLKSANWNRNEPFYQNWKPGGLRRFMGSMDNHVIKPMAQSGMVANTRKNIAPRMSRPSRAPHLARPTSEQIVTNARRIMDRHKSYYTS